MKIRYLIILATAVLTLSACGSDLGTKLRTQIPELPSAPDKIPDAKDVSSSTDSGGIKEKTPMSPTGKSSAQLTFAWCKNDLTAASAKLHTDKAGNLFGAGVAHGTIIVKKVTIWEEVQGVFLVLDKAGTDPLIYSTFADSAKVYSDSSGKSVDFASDAHVMILGTLENNNIKSTAELSNFTEDQILEAIQNKTALSLHMNFFFRAYEFGLPASFTAACKIEATEPTAAQNSLAKMAANLPALPNTLPQPAINKPTFYKNKMPWCGDTTLYIPRPFSITKNNRPDGITQARGILTVLQKDYDEVSPVTLYVSSLKSDLTIGGVKNDAFISSAAISPADEKSIMNAIKNTLPITLDLYFVDQEPIPVGVPSHFTKACRIVVKN